MLALRVRLRRLIALLLLLPLTLVFSGRAAAQTTAPDLSKILDHVVARAQQEEKQNRQGRAVVCTEHAHIEDLNDDGSVKEAYTTVRVPVLLDGKVYMRLLSRNGAPPSGKYLEQEKAREKKFRDALKRPKEDSGTDFHIDRELIDRFQVVFAGEETLNGRAAYGFAFLPKPGDKPERVRAERVINHLGGRLWIDAQDYEVAKADVALTQPVSFYGILGKLRTLHFQIEQHYVGPGLWAVAHTEVRIDGRAVFSSIRQHVVTDCSDYKLRGEVR